MENDLDQRPAGLERLRAERDLADLPDDLLNEALTHRSYSFEHDASVDNERLEFLGDAILGAVAAELLYLRYPELDEGGLSKRKGQIVSRAMLGDQGSELGLGPLILLGAGESRSGGGRRRSILGCALEAITGALYVHGGYTRVRTWLEEQVLGPLIERCEADEQKGDYKSALQELTQRRLIGLPIYRVVEERGPEHDRIFVVEVKVQDRLLARGEGIRKKAAENEAARIAFSTLRFEEEPNS